MQTIRIIVLLRNIKMQMSKVKQQTLSSSRLALNYSSWVISPKVISYKKPLSTPIPSFRNKSS